MSVKLINDLPENVYRADQTAISQSDMKLILQCPAKYRWNRDNPPEPKQVFDFGTAAHRLVLGVGMEIEVIRVEVEATRDGRRQKIIADNHMFRAVQEAEDRARAAGKIPLLPAEYQHVQDMADKLSEHRLAMELLSEGQPEVTAYSHDQDTNVDIKGRFDWLGTTLITDYKSAASSDPDVFVRKAVDLGYDLQAAVYLDLARDNGHPGHAFAHIVQEKEPPYVVTVVVLPADLIDRGRRLKRRALEMYRDCLDANRWPGYCPDDDFATPAAPSWALND